MRGMISTIQRFSIQDGPGIRTTVFFKGCSLRCSWCSNPETQMAYPQLAFISERCFKSKCTICIFSCKRRAVKRENGRILIDHKKCSLCGECIRNCPQSNLKIIGEEWDISDLMTEVLKDKVFYKYSKGGVTLSGGEPLLQYKFLSRFLKECKKYSLHTVVDTSFHVPWEGIEAVEEWVDIFYVDLKHVDEGIHMEYTGRSNRSILKNIERIAKGISSDKVVIRIPFIPRVNSDETSQRRMANYIKNLNGKWPIHLLPYHRLGVEKYKWLGLKNQGRYFRLPKDEELVKAQNIFQQLGLFVEVIN